MEKIGEVARLAAEFLEHSSPIPPRQSSACSRKLIAKKL